MAIKYIEDLITTVDGPIIVNYDAPLDARSIADNFSDLTNVENWIINDSLIAYDGMLVTVLNTEGEKISGLYRLSVDYTLNPNPFIALKNSISHDYCWILVGSENQSEVNVHWNKITL